MDVIGTISAKGECEMELRSLGRTSEEIAKVLTKLGIKGKLQQADSCPIFQYLKSKGFDVEYVDDLEVNVRGVEFRTPKNVASFIIDFDCCVYPELVEWT